MARSARGVVPRGAHGHEGDALAPALELGQRHQPGARGAAGRRPRIRPGVGVGVDVPAPAGAERLELGQVGGECTRDSSSTDASRMAGYTTSSSSPRARTPSMTARSRDCCSGW